jgi:hypothetical protein
VPPTSLSPPPIAKDGKGAVVVPYLATASRLVRHGGAVTAMF